MGADELNYYTGRRQTAAERRLAEDDFACNCHDIVQERPTKPENRHLTAAERRLAEDDFANSHPFLVLFVSIFFVLYILAILIIDRLVTRAKRDAMQRGRKWNFSDCVKAWMSKQLNAM